ncbi:MAG: biotin attachment protein [Eudoraea sp.]|nr:biotin attachment protein [Eudoraea sp.]
MDQKFNIIVNGNTEFSLSEHDLQKADILQTASAKYHVLKDGKPFNVRIVDGNFQKRTYIIKVGNETYEVMIKNALDMQISSMGFTLGASKNVSSIVAPMPGLVLEIPIEVGQQVNEDEPLLILEAMKMENVLSSPREGIIKSISVAKGDTVEKKQLLITFE